MSIFEQLDLHDPVFTLSRDRQELIAGLGLAWIAAYKSGDAAECTRLVEQVADLQGEHYVEAAETICDALDDALAAAIRRMNEVAG